MFVQKKTARQTRESDLDPAPSDQRLVEFACRGDVDSFAELYNRHFALAVGIAYGLLADRSLAEDAAQEAFAEACRHLRQLHDGQKFPHWLATICRRVARRMAKSRRRLHALPEQELPARNDGDTTDGETIREAVRRLPRTAREVIVLHYFSELSYGQIAAALDVTPAAVHGRLIRARRLLRHRLRPSEAEETNP